MDTDPKPRGDREDRLDHVVAAYLAEIDSGVIPDRRDWLVRHPDFFDELSDFFADRDQVEGIAAPLRQLVGTSDEALALEGLEPPAHPEHLGRMAGYEVTEWLGQGGMGVVVKAFDENLNRYVAIKLMVPQWSADAAARRRFSREAQAAAAISHPHVVTIHAVGEWRGRSYLVMEYINGPSLEQRIREYGPLEIKEILRIGSQVAAGLAAAHSQGLIHRDVKPSNIMLENDLPRVKLTDFGLARAVDDIKLTQQGFLAGTPQYMAPEQARGERLDRRTDLFSLGSVLYALCTGRPAFTGESSVEVIHRVCTSTPPPIQKLNPDIPDWLVEIVTRLHAKEPADRFQSAGEVAELLEKHLARLQDPSLPAIVHEWAGTTAHRRSRAMRLRRLASSRWTASIFLILLGAVSAFELMHLIAPPTATNQKAGLNLAEQAGKPTPEKPTAAASDRREAASAPSKPSSSPSPPLTAPRGIPLSLLDEARLVQTYDFNFLDKNYDFRWLRISAPGGATSLVRPDPRGVRITVPPKLGESVAIETKFGIHGDFDLRAAYEVLSVETPAGGFGVGPELLVKPPGDWDKTASLSRFVRPKDIVYSAVIVRKVDGVTRVEGNWPAARAKKGILRLVRTGPTIHYLVAEGDDALFHEINQGEFGTEDFEMARISAVLGGSVSAIDLIWKNLTIRAESLPGLDGGRAVATNRFAWWLPGLGVVALCLVGAGVWLRAAAHRRANQTEMPHIVPDPVVSKPVPRRNRDGKRVE